MVVLWTQRIKMERFLCTPTIQRVFQGEMRIGDRQYVISGTTEWSWSTVTYRLHNSLFPYPPSFHYYQVDLKGIQGLKEGTPHGLQMKWRFRHFCRWQQRGPATPRDYTGTEVSAEASDRETQPWTKLLTLIPMKFLKTKYHPGKTTEFSFKWLNFTLYN